jgi:hypothetical protein
MIFGGRVIASSLLQSNRPLSLKGHMLYLIKMSDGTMKLELELVVDQKFFMMETSTCFL